MQMLRAHIDAAAATGDANPKTVTLWFNAWKYEGKEEIQSVLIHAILRELTKGRTLLDDVKATFNRLKKGASVLKLAKTIAKSAITLTPNFPDFLETSVAPCRSECRRQRNSGRLPRSPLSEPVWTNASRRSSRCTRTGRAHRQRLPARGRAAHARA